MQVCISYTLGALGGYVYLRLLGRSVDGMAGQGGLASGVASAVGNQRLLIPVILALGYNRRAAGAACRRNAAWQALSDAAVPGVGSLHAP